MPDLMQMFAKGLITSVEVLPRNSSSATMQIKLTSSDPEYQVMIMKCWAIDPRGILEETSLDYEANVYKNIISEIVDTKECDFFVRYVDYTTISLHEFSEILNRSYDQVNELVFRLLITASSKLSNTKGEYVSRPFYVDDYVGKGYKIRTLVTLYTEGGTVYQYLKNNTELRDIMNVLFQLLLGCYAMEINGLVHYDIHSNNILLSKEFEPRTIRYEIGDKVYNFDVTRKVRIFDFDISYKAELGVNPKVDEYRQRGYFMDNMFMEKWSMLKSVCYFIYASKSNSLTKLLASFLSKDPVTQEKIINLKDDVCMMEMMDEYGEGILRNLNSTKEVIDFVASTIPGLMNDKTPVEVYKMP